LKLSYKEDSIYFDFPDKKIVPKKQLIAFGSVINIEFPIIKKGFGKTPAYFFGNGMNDQKDLINNQKELFEIVNLAWDSKQTFPMKYKKMKLLFCSLSKILNVRLHVFDLEMQFVRLFSVPHPKLEWVNVPFNTNYIETIKFMRSDFKENIKEIQVSIPRKIKNILFIQPFKTSNENVTFILNTEKLKPDELLEENIIITAYCSDKLTIKHKMPVRIKSYASKVGIDLVYQKWMKNDINQRLCLSIKNEDSNPLKIYSINWRNKQLSRVWSLSTIFNETWPLHLTKGGIQLCYHLNINASWYKSVSVTDIIEVKTNSHDMPVWSKKISIKIFPKNTIMATIWRFFIKNKKMRLHNGS